MVFQEQDKGMFHWDQVRKHMHKLTGLEIEKRAIMEVIVYFEFQFDNLMKQGVLEHNKLNNLRILQGINPKMRIDRDCIRNAIKTINSNEHSLLSDKTGGKIKKINNNFEKHTQKESVFSEVE